MGISLSLEGMLSTPGEGVSSSVAMVLLAGVASCD
jgi:hypothetical protein